MCLIKFYKVNEFNDGRDMVNSPIEDWSNNRQLDNVEYISYSTLDNMLKLQYYTHMIRLLYYIENKCQQFREYLIQRSLPKGESVKEWAKKNAKH